MRPRTIFYIGFLIFLIGFMSVFFNRNLYQALQILGTGISIYAIVKWLREPDFKDKFKRDKAEDGLTYFWNKLAIRIWSGMFFAFMFINTLTYLVLGLFKVLSD